MSVILRYSIDTRGAITFTGNTLGLSQKRNSNDAGKEGSIGAFITTDLSKQVPTYPAGTTSNYLENDSSAELNMPVGSTVLHATLIWGGNCKTKDEDITSAINDDIVFKTPSGTFNISPESNTNFLVAIDNEKSFYTKYADVTQLVQNGGVGTYNVGKVAGLLDPLISSTGETNHAGWTLQVVYENALLPYRNLTTWILSEAISNSGTSQVDIPISGFKTPTSGSLNARLLLSVQEGDVQGSGDRVYFGPTAGTVVQLSGPNNIANNFFASQINGDDGLIDTSGTFGNRNHDALTQTPITAGRQGWDITNIDVSNEVVYGQEQAVIRLATVSGETYLANGVGLQIDIIPIVELTKEVDQTEVEIGEQLVYTITIENTSSIDIENYILTDPLTTQFNIIEIEVNDVGVVGDITTGLNLGTLSAGETIEVKVYVEALTVPMPNPYINTATGTGEVVLQEGEEPYELVNEDTAEVLITYKDLEMEKTVDENILVIGEEHFYTIEITNPNNAIVEDFILKDDLPSGIEVLEIDRDGNILAGDIESGINIGDLDPFETTTVTIKFIATEELNPEPFFNFAEGSGTLIDTEIELETDAQEEGGVETTLPQIEITKTSSTDTVLLDEPFEYTINISNPNDVIIRDFILTDELSPYIEVISVERDGNIVNGDINTGINIGDLQPNSVTTVVLTVKVVQDLPIEPYFNVVDGIGVIDRTEETVEDEATNNIGVEVLIPSINVIKTSDTECAVVGETVEYKLVIENDGDFDLFDLVISDLLDEQLEFVEGSVEINGVPYEDESIITGIMIDELLIGESIEITFDVLIENRTTGIAENIANVSGFYIIAENNIKIIEETSNRNLIAIDESSLKITKEANKEFANLGEEITYTVKLINDGTTQLKDIIFKDILPEEVTFNGVIKVNGNELNGVDLESGVNVGDLEIGEMLIINYTVIVESGSCDGLIENNAFADYTYVSDCGVIGDSSTAIVSDTVKNNVQNFKQIILNKKFKLEKCNMMSVEDVTGSAKEKISYVIKTYEGKSEEGQILTGNKLILIGELLLNIEYTKDNEQCSMHTFIDNSEFGTFIILPKDYDGRTLTSTINIEDISFEVIEQDVYINVVIMIVVA